jgi:hypothetical protein
VHSAHCIRRPTARGGFGRFQQPLTLLLIQVIVIIAALEVWASFSRGSGSRR